MGYRPRFIDSSLIKKRLSEMASLGVKSVMYSGEGEPLLHKDIGGIIAHTRSCRIDVALTTNGVLLSRDMADAALKNITWIKVSINAGNKKTYGDVHGADPGDFSKVINNVSYAVKLKKSKKYACAIGMQLLLLPENRQEVLGLARLARKIGVDYLVVKPYSQHGLSKTKRYKNIRYNEYLSIADSLRALNTDKFQVVFRMNTMKKWDSGTRSYKHCYALPFWAYIDAGGGVWGCSAYLSDKRFFYGDIYRDTFRKIWRGDRRKKILKQAECRLDTGCCRVNCRMDEVNRYLWGLKHPPEHVNFI
jgi:molybdenum cofactor biosynthesis enzyme MoaA